jgi:hypothetical protein
MSIEEKVLSGDSPLLSYKWSRQAPFDVPLDSGSQEWQGSSGHKGEKAIRWQWVPW